MQAMNCDSCGGPWSPGLLICPQCGHRRRMHVASAAVAAPQAAPGFVRPVAPIATIEPAGLGRRAGAFCIDFVVLLPAVAVSQSIVPLFGGLAVWWLYFALFETSRWQGTPGKRMLGLKVTDVNGIHVRFGRASGRFAAKLLSAAPLFVGFLFPAWTRHKQALHDLIAGTLVVRR